MYAQVFSAVMHGLTVFPIRIEADVSSGLPGLHLIGYLGSDVKEAGDRVRTALHNSGFSLPAKRMTINLAPADLKKSGSLFDLPITVALAAAAEYVPKEALAGTLILGEVGLNGEIGAVRGVLSMVAYAKKAGNKQCVVPAENEAEALLVPGIRVVGVSTITEVVAYLKGEAPPKPSAGEKLKAAENAAEDPAGESVDFSDICGQQAMKRTCMIAAAGFHNILFTGPPGAGKTMAARRLPGIMPPLSEEESLELTKIYSVAGELKSRVPLVQKRPFRAPHHTVTQAALVGGGQTPKPGEITLSHKGVLFLDEFGEYRRYLLEQLRQPLEDHTVCLSRNRGRYIYPADFLLVAAMNPCPCGYYPDARCRCSPHELHRYRGKISRPLLDRIDLFLRLEPVAVEEIMKDKHRAGELSSALMQQRVEETWKRQKKRFAGESFCFNGRIPAPRLQEFCPMEASAKSFAKMAFEKLGLSARAWHRSLRVARTIADLSGEEAIRQEHMAEALGYRLQEEELP